MKLLVVAAPAALLAACSELLPGMAPPPETPEQALANEIRSAGPCRTQVSEAAAEQLGNSGAAAPAVNRIVLSGQSGIGWNGAPVDPTRLRQYLDVTSQMLPEPLLVVRAEPGTDPAHVERVRETIWRALNCRPEL